MVRTSGLSHAIIRPSLIAAPGNEALGMMLRMLRLAPVVPVIGNGLYQMQPVAAEDAAEAFVTAVENAGIVGTFDIAGPEALTYHQMLDQLERALGVHRRRVPVPVGVVRFSAYAGTVLPNLNPITPDQLQMLLEGNTTATNAIESAFGVTPRPFADAAREIAAPYAAGDVAAPAHT
jgi:NADH dehydrogenase